MADGQVVFEVTADGKHVKADIKDITKAIEAEGKKWDQAASESTDKMGKSFLNLKTVATAAVTAIGAALIKFGQESIDAASDLAEVQNVVDTVFGDGASQIESWAQKAGQQFGLTETMAKKFTSTLGAMMKSSGLAGDQIVNMSTDLAGLAADMASFYNLDFETAFEKIRAGISGETMPLKQLGINMSVANLEAFALAQGLEKTFSQMDQGEQTMLRYQYLMQATADAQGDFEKTSNGFANAQRRIQASIDSIKTSVGEILLPTVEKAVAGVASFLSQIASDMMPERTIMDEFNEIHIDSETKLAEIQKTYDSASDLIKILKGIEQETVTLQDGTTVSLTSLFGDIAEIEKAGGDVGAYIQSLGLDVDYVVLEYNKWKEATRQLTSLVPSLTAQINSETGAINGGTDALQEHLDEQKRVWENQVYWAEYYAKAEAVARAKGEQAGLEITAKAQQMAADRAKAALEQMRQDRGYGDYSYIVHGSIVQPYSESEKEWNAAIDEYTRLQNKADEAQKKAEKSANDLVDAESLLKDELKVVEELTGETFAQHEKGAQDAADATEYLGRSTEDWVSALKDAPKAAEAIKAVIDYYNGVRDATEQAVNSTVKGFEKITTAWDELTQKNNDLVGEEANVWNEYGSILNKYGNTADEIIQKMQERQKAAEKTKDKEDDLTDEEIEAYNALVKVKQAQDEVNESLKQYKPEGMKESLQSQIDFMENYLKNLDQLKDWGLSAEFIASLADGSKESASFLQGLVEGGADAAASVDELYQTVSENKKGFVDKLTDYKLAADQTFSDLSQTMADMVDQLDMGEEAYDASSETVYEIAAGIESEVPSVAAAVDSLISALAPLDSIGFTWGFSNGMFNFEWHGIDGSNEKGLDYVPFDGYLSELHEGEGILTAEENRIWQRFKNGQAGHANVDYETLGGVMRDNVKTGGDVYLDGRTVGQVISGIQGRSYRNLQRSGWQG